MPHMQAANDAANGLAGALLTEAPIGAKLTSVALFIDGESTQARLLLPPMQVCRNLTDATCRLHLGLVTSSSCGSFYTLAPCCSQI